MNRTAVSVGARAAQQQWGYDGAGVGVAVIDSGIAAWHDDLSYQGSSTKVRVVNGQRVTGFVDFVNGLPAGLRRQRARHARRGHHRRQRLRLVRRARGHRAGGAPGQPEGARQHGGGVISDVIAAFEWAIANRVAHNIRVINLSVGARVTESYETDPLTLAAKRAVDAGIVVVAAAGNLGQKNGRPHEEDAVRQHHGARATRPGC